MKFSLDHWLSRFRSVASSGPAAIPWTHVHRGSRSGTHVVIGVMVHGNEYGTLPAAVRLIEALERGTVRWTGPVTLFVGNPEAGLAERRYLDFDLNRAWSFQAEHRGREVERAHQLRPLLDSADLFLDLHQTLLESRSAFWTFPWSPIFGHWARILGTAPVGITRPSGQVFATAGLKCIDEYVRDRGRPGFTVELGQKGFDPAQADNALRTMLTLLETQERIDLGHSTLESESESGSPVRWFQTVHREPWGDPDRRLRPGLSTWTPVRAGEDLSADASPPILSPVDGALLFPKYPDPQNPPPAHVFHVGVPLQAHPAEVFGGAR